MNSTWKCQAVDMKSVDIAIILILLSTFFDALDYVTFSLKGIKMNKLTLFGTNYHILRGSKVDELWKMSIIQMLPKKVLQSDLNKMLLMWFTIKLYSAVVDYLS